MPPRHCHTSPGVTGNVSMLFSMVEGQKLNPEDEQVYPEYPEYLHKHSRVITNSGCQWSRSDISNEILKAFIIYQMRD